MTWSLEVKHGDLTLSPGRTAGLGTVTGSAKLVQDLRCWILENIGTDPLHPSFGSSLDNELNVIGQPIDSMRQMLIESELRRIVDAYRDQQLQRAKGDAARYGRVTLSKGEIILSLNNISFVQNQDSLSVILSITTGDNQSVSVILGLNS